MGKGNPGYLLTMDPMGLRKALAHDSKIALDIVEQLRGGAKHRWSYQRIHDHLLELIKRNVARELYQTYSLPQAIQIRRVRWLKGKKRPINLAELGPPPADETDAGRCHQPRHPVCYCSLYEDTALAEVNAVLGEQYVVATFLMPSDIVLMSIGEFDYWRRTGNPYMGGANFASTLERYQRLLEDRDWHVPASVEAFLAEEFIKPATMPTDYKITSAVADILFDRNSIHFGLKDAVEALVYPSVAFRGGVNFAIRSEVHNVKLQLLEAETKLVEITDVFGYGIYDYCEVATLKSVASDGMLTWGAG